MSYTYALGTYGYTTDTSVTSFPEERRQWRVKIEDHITDEADRLDSHLDTIETKVDNVNTYIVQTIKPELDDIKQTVNAVNSYVTGRLTEYVNDVEGYTDTLESSQESQSTILHQILTKVNALNPW